MPRKKKTILVASPEVLVRLRQFKYELRQLCGRCGLTLVASTDSEEQIELLDVRDTRPPQIQRDWPAVAFCSRVSSKGVDMTLYDYELSDPGVVQDLTDAGILPKEAKRA